MDNSEKLMFYMKDLVSNLAGPKDKINPYYVGKLDFEVDVNLILNLLEYPKFRISKPEKGECGDRKWFFAVSIKIFSRRQRFNRN
jgi:hypothetical protein